MQGKGLVQGSPHIALVGRQTGLPLSIGAEALQWGQRALVLCQRGAGVYLFLARGSWDVLG